jgi:hypothetical protein
VVHPKLYSVTNVAGYWDPTTRQFDIVSTFPDRIDEVTDGYPQLFEYLTNAAQGDELVAEWLALTVLSSVQYRHANEVGGRVMLNILTASNSTILPAIAALYTPHCPVPLSLTGLHADRYIAK